MKTRLLYDHHILAEPTEKMNISLAILLRQRNCFLFLLIGFGTWPASDLRILMVRADSPKSNEKRGFFKVKRRGRMEKSPTTKPTIKQGKFNLYDDTNTNGKWEYWSIIISCFFQQPTSDDDPNVSRGLNHQPYRGTKEIGEARGAIEVSSSSTGYQATCLNQNPVFSLVAN